MIADIDNEIKLPEHIKNRTEAGAVEIFENIFTEDISKKMIEIFEECNHLTDCPIKYGPALIGHGDLGGNIRSNLIMPLYIHNDINNEQCSCGINDLVIYIQEIFSLCVRFYTNKFDVDIDFDEGFQLLKYGPGKEYKPHIDFGPGHAHRVLSGLIYINPSEYEGGGTYFENFNLNLKVSTPSIVLFPSNYAYLHRAKAVFSGNKYAIVTWLGPSWMRPR